MKKKAINLLKGLANQKIFNINSIMARVTTEDCTTSIPNRFQLVIYSCSRARELLSGSEANVAIDNDKQTVIALREIADKKIDLN